MLLFRDTDLLKKRAIWTCKTQGRQTTVHIAEADEVDRTLSLRIGIVFAGLFAVTRKRCLGVGVDVDVEFGRTDWPFILTLLTSDLWHSISSVEGQSD